MLVITERVAAPASVLRFTFSRSGGPGGQNVNKVSTRATLTVLLDDLTPYLPAYAMARLPEIAGPYLAEGRLVIHASETRSQHDNKQACIDKLVALLQRALHRPRPRRKTKPSRAAKQRRLDGKSKRSQLKQTRQRPRGE